MLKSNSPLLIDAYGRETYAWSCEYTFSLYDKIGGLIMFDIPFLGAIQQTHVKVDRAVKRYPGKKSSKQKTRQIGWEVP